jgi:hypothetical protein
VTAVTFIGLLALEPPQGAQLTAGQGMRGRSALLNPTDVQDCVFQVRLLPAQVNQLGGP